LKIVLSSELNLIRALENDEDGNKNDSSRGTGKDHLEIDEILKKL